jgi:Chromosome segregation ATPases
LGAKPEELLSYVEEAAGISKYKERKRETESRIRRTSENISRLKDLEDEVKRSIRRLNAEANLTSKYKKLRDKEKEYQKFILSDDMGELLKLMNESEKENKSIDKDLEKMDGDRLALVAKRDVTKTQLMESLKELEEEQRGFFESGAKISLIEEKEKTVSIRIEELSKEEQKNLANLEDLSKELDSAKSDLSQINEDIMQDILNDSKKIIKKIESDISDKDSVLIEKSLKEFWKKGYQYGIGESGEAVETINALREQFASRNEQIIIDIDSMKKDLVKEKGELSGLIEIRKTQELK